MFSLLLEVVWKGYLRACVWLFDTLGWLFNYIVGYFKYQKGKFKLNGLSSW